MKKLAKNEEEIIWHDVCAPDGMKKYEKYCKARMIECCWLKWLFWKEMVWATVLIWLKFGACKRMWAWGDALTRSLWDGTKFE